MLHTAELLIQTLVVYTEISPSREANICTIFLSWTWCFCIFEVQWNYTIWSKLKENEVKGEDKYIFSKLKDKNKNNNINH